ncbi:MAG: hypothetical protein PHU48_04755 [Candidatus Cloacimonetes bacterium]|nr:hypothetical protein [Candidatus Cloacimonadota bacterium]
MKFYKLVFCFVVLALFTVSSVYAAMAVPTTGTKRLDLDLENYHNVGNIWLRVSNYGFFGAGSDGEYPSLEYPGGSGIDYLFQGALWFGAKKHRRDDYNRRLYWKHFPPENDYDTIHDQHADYVEGLYQPVIDTLVSVGFDGDLSLFEFLPAYNPLLDANASVSENVNYSNRNLNDALITASTRTQKRGVDDDGDGLIDEDFPGYTFPFRSSSELPDEFALFGDNYLHEMTSSSFTVLDDPRAYMKWFPLGFMNLYDPNKQHGEATYTYAQPYDDDHDGRYDEDGAPVSEQDYIGYYYDYCPFGTPGERDYGQSAGSSDHHPLNIKVRQMSYQWSYEYIKNLVYVEFNITNMNEEETLKDCAMGIYMDADVGPQTWGSDKAADDKSGYVKGKGYEFAYTYDADFDGGLSEGFVGARVCTPNPDSLKFHCWYWKVGDGPDDTDPISTVSAKTHNEKYWLLTGKNPRTDNTYVALRKDDPNITEWEQPSPNDTRFLFAFYGAQPGSNEYNETDENGRFYKRWDLEPKKTMKIVVAVFPGKTKEELKSTAAWAMTIYGKAQNLITVTEPDIESHYNPPEPPVIPKMYAELIEQEAGHGIDIYWDNRSEFTQDFMNVDAAEIGWSNPASASFDETLDSSPLFYQNNGWPDWFPERFRCDFDDVDYPWANESLMNPFTGYRLQHDFQGYAVWGRSGSGNREDWELMQRWDKVETGVDTDDYHINDNASNPLHRKDYGGYQGIDTGLPNPSDPDGVKNPFAMHSPEYNVVLLPEDYSKYYQLDEYFLYKTVEGDTFHGWPLYSAAAELNDYDSWQTLQNRADSIDVAYAAFSNEERQAMKARIFMHEHLKDKPELFDALYDPKTIPLVTFALPAPPAGGPANPDPEQWEEIKKDRLARRYYKSTIWHPRRGVEYYVAVTAYDRGIPSQNLSFLETGRDADANMKIIFPGSLARDSMDDIKVIPNPYLGRSKFDGRLTNDEKGDKSRRLWFVNLPKRCTIRIYTLAGDLVKTLDHEGATSTDIVTISKDGTQGLSADGMHAWDLLSKNNQIIAPGVYLFSVENKNNDKIKVGKFVIIK